MQSLTLTQSGAIFGRQVDVIEEERGDADGEHDGNEEEKEYVKAARLERLQLCPKFHKVLERRGRHIDAVGGRVAQKEDEELVVVVAHTIVHPWAVVVHFEHARLTNAAVVRTVGLDAFALVTEANAAAVGAIEQRQVMGFGIEDGFGGELGVGRGHLIDLGVGQIEVVGRTFDRSEYGLIVGGGEHEQEQVIENEIDELFEPAAAFDLNCIFFFK